MLRNLLAALLVCTPALAADPPHQHGGDDSNAAVPTHQEHPLDKDAPKPAGKDVSLPVAGKRAKAYVARPRGKPQGAILVIHEWWGLNDWVKNQADQLAQQGYLALAVDLYKGKVATDKDEAGKLMAGKDEQWGDAVEEAGREWLKKEGKGAKLATIGWCMGGGESLKASLNDGKDVSATVIYYGMPVDDPAKLKALHGPVLGIFARQDGWITPAKVQAFDKALTEAGVQHEIHEFDADHAFANPSGGKYNGPAAKEAWELTTKFLARNLKAH